MATPGALRGTTDCFSPLASMLSYRKDMAAPQGQRRKVRGEERMFSEHIAAPFEHKEQLIFVLSYILECASIALGKGRQLCCSCP